jgi:hypothetical protein
MVEEVMMGAKQVGLLGLLAAGLVLSAGQAARADGFLSAGPVVPSSSSGYNSATVASGDLEQQRAGDFNFQQVNQKNKAIQTGNQANDADSGDVNISAGAMNSLNGVGQVVANSGTLGVAQGNISLTVNLNP